MIATLPWPPSGASEARIDWCDLNSSRAAGEGTPGELDRDTISAPERLPANRVLASRLAAPWWSKQLLRLGDAADTKAPGPRLQLSRI